MALLDAIMDWSIPDLEQAVYLDAICRDNGVEFSDDEILEYSVDNGKFLCNTFIYMCLERLAKGFIEKNKEKIANILSESVEFVERVMLDEEKWYKITANYLDIHISFEEDEVQRLFEKSSFYYR